MLLHLVTDGSLFLATIILSWAYITAFWQLSMPPVLPSSNSNFIPEWILKYINLIMVCPWLNLLILFSPWSPHYGPHLFNIQIPSQPNSMPYFSAFPLLLPPTTTPYVPQTPNYSVLPTKPYNFSKLCAFAHIAPFAFCDYLQSAQGPTWIATAL